MKRTLVIPAACATLTMLAGCGTRLNEALLLGAEAGARTVLDVLISDLFSDLPDLLSLPFGAGQPPAGGGGTTGGEDGGGGSGGGGGGGGLTGDAAAGMTLFTENSCFACHCDDASGGCLPGAPNIQGRDFATIKERLQGETPHPGGKFPELTDQDIADIQAFLAAQAAP